MSFICLIQEPNTCLAEKQQDIYVKCKIFWKTLCMKMFFYNLKAFTINNYNEKPITGSPVDHGKKN